jgi:predicted  nucleic acid-binding Zn-ribbon protein
LEEEGMSVEERLAGLESEVKHVRDDITDLKRGVRSLEKQVQEFRGDLHSFRTDVAKEFAAVKVSIDSLKTLVERANIWMLMTGGGVLLSTFITVGHALKVF